MLACRDGPELTEALSKPEHVSATELEDQLWLGVPLQGQRITPSFAKNSSGLHAVAALLNMTGCHWVYLCLTLAV